MSWDCITVNVNDRNALNGQQLSQSNVIPADFSLSSRLAKLYAARATAYFLFWFVTSTSPTLYCSYIPALCPSRWHLLKKTFICSNYWIEIHLICNLFLQTFYSLRWNPGCCDPPGKMQVHCWCLMMGHRTGHYVLAGVHQATKKPNAVNSFLSKHSGSLVLIGPGNSSYASMTALHYFCVLCYLTLRGWD